MNEMNREHLFDIVAALTAGATKKDSKSDLLSPDMRQGDVYLV
jgi:hypothetical protein